MEFKKVLKFLVLLFRLYKKHVKKEYKRLKTKYINVQKIE